MLNTEITILHVDGAPAPDMPSHLFPGCGSDGAEFKVTAGPIPSYGDMSHLLYEAIVDGCLTEYDESTGQGYFKVVDGDAPPVGSVHVLDNSLHAGGQLLAPAGAEAALEQGAIEAGTAPIEKEPSVMDKKAIRQRLAELRAQGVSKQDIFQELKGGAYSDGRLAYMLASRAALNLVRAHKWKIRLMITVAIIQMMLAFLVGWQVGEPVSTGYALLGALIACTIPALTAYGFIKHNVAAYNLFIAVSLFQYWLQVWDVIQGYNAAWVGVTFASIMLTFVIYLRLRLFPDIRAIRPAKDGSGQYAFA
ncbi:MAG: hypothetical protein FD131_4636 [Rhodocyclaceae bacterium]|nr:MAG: hypothetical protein FD131_4636 [Rhodocyclaceae bacterium]